MKLTKEQMIILVIGVVPLLIIAIYLFSRPGDVDDEAVVKVPEDITYSYQWKLGEAWLYANPTADGGGEWVYENEAGLGEQASVARYAFDLAQFDPADVLQVSYAVEPELVIIAFEQDTEHDFDQPGWGEVIIDPYTRKTYTPWPRLIQNPDLSYYAHPYFDMPTVQSSEPAELTQITQWGDGSYTLEDERGTLRITTEGRRQIDRYGHLVITAMKSFEQGWPLPDGPLSSDYWLMIDREGRSYITRMDDIDFYPFEADLWNENWQLFYRNGFYRIDAGKLETLNYEPLWNSRYAVKRNRYDFGEAQLTGQAGAELKFVEQGAAFRISLYDALRYDTDPDHAREAFEYIQIWELDDELFRIADRADRLEQPTQGDSNASHVERLPEMIFSMQDGSDAIPAEVLQAVEEAFFSGSGDAVPSVLYREVDGQWVVLVDKWLYRVQDGRLQEIGSLPIETTIWMTNYSIGIGAQDLIKLGAYWYVADTIGNRILQLDEQLNIVRELPLPYPSKISRIEDDRLEVISLQGISIVSDQLALIHTSAAVAEHVNEEQLIEREIGGSDIHPSAYYAAPDSGVVWYYDSSGYLNRYEPESSKLNRQFVGLLMNGFGEPRIIPYANWVMLLFDDRALIYDRDGSWVKMIKFPRVQPDGIYDYTSDGENAYVLEEDAGMLYLVQGFRIIAIDLNTDEVKTIFRQSFSNIGKIRLADGKLLFSLQSNYEHRYNSDIPGEERQSQLCVVELATGKLTRYEVAGFWLSK